MYELLKRMWVEGKAAEARVRAAILAAKNRGMITEDQANSILAMSRSI